MNAQLQRRKTTRAHIYEAGTGKAPLPLLHRDRLRLDDRSKCLVRAVNDAPRQTGPRKVEVRAAVDLAPRPTHREHLTHGAHRTDEPPPDALHHVRLDHVDRVEQGADAGPQQGAAHKVVHQAHAAAARGRQRVLDRGAEQEKERIRGPIAQQHPCEAAVVFRDAECAQLAHGVVRAAKGTVVLRRLQQRLDALKRCHDGLGGPGADGGENAQGDIPHPSRRCPRTAPLKPQVVRIIQPKHECQRH
mmetsp:Transcript_13804/g.44185  ORF Transcript_13804/g.44185 Transcript_13804/m.44185 type:complete len:246 (+) Transcript_13804:18-755(+)